MTDSSSRTVAVYQQVRSDILSGRFEPGRKLRIQELAAMLDVSPSVVRESLSRLSAESLVIAEPQRGFRVSPINAEDVRDLTEIRIDIEIKCLQRAMSKGGLEWETEIVAANHSLSRTPYDVLEVGHFWTAAHARFHLALVSACDSPWLLRIREQLFVQGERYRRINMRMSRADRDLAAEHALLAEAVLKRDAGLAIERMTAHLRSTETATLLSLKAEQAAVA